MNDYNDSYARHRATLQYLCKLLFKLNITDGLYSKDIHWNLRDEYTKRVTKK